jgi:cytochrome P450
VSPAPEQEGASTSIATPAGRPSGLGGLFCLRVLPWLAARAGAWFARIWGKPLKLGKLLLVARHCDVEEVFARDLDFTIQPINGARFDQIGYHFILGMDRSVELSTERQALYTALSAVDMAAIRAVTAADLNQRLAAAGPRIDIVEDYARPVAAATASALFGIAPDDHALFMDVSRAIFGHCFLNLAGDKVIAERAVAAAERLTAWFDAEIARRRETGDFGSDMMGQLLRQGVSDDLTRRSLGGMLVGAIDTTATVTAKVMTVLMNDPALLRLASEDRTDLVRLYGWCQEALRRWPHVPVLGRDVAADTILAGVAVPAGAKVLLWTQAAMLDPGAFPDPLTMRPDRPWPGYLHLGGGLHPCAGRDINAWQIPMLIGGLLERQPQRIGDIAWAGPFPAHVWLH